MVYFPNIATLTQPDFIHFMHTFLNPVENYMTFFFTFISDKILFKALYMCGDGCYFKTAIGFI